MTRTLPRIIMIAVIVFLLLAIGTVVGLIALLPSDVRSGTIDDIRWTLCPREDGSALLILSDEFGKEEQVIARQTGKDTAEVKTYVISKKRESESLPRMLVYRQGKVESQNWSGEVMPYAEAMKHAESLFVEWTAKIQKAEEEASPQIIHTSATVIHAGPSSGKSDKEDKERVVVFKIDGFIDGEESIIEEPFRGVGPRWKAGDRAEISYVQLPDRTKENFKVTGRAFAASTKPEGLLPDF